MGIEPTPEGRTAYLERYDEFEADIVLEILTEARIFAFHKHRPQDNDHYMYNPTMESDRGVIMVDADRLEEARALIAEQLPIHLEAIRTAMEEGAGSPEEPPA
jgi:hypothetical protein